MADLTSNTDGLQEVLDMIDSRIVDTSQFQPKDADLTAIAGLPGEEGFLKKTQAGAWDLDTSTYLPLTGGTMTGNIVLDIDSDGESPGIVSPDGKNVLTIDSDSWPILGNTGVPTVIYAEYLSLYNTGYVENARFAPSGFSCLGYDDEPTTNLCSIKYDASEGALKFIFK